LAACCCSRVSTTIADATVNAADQPPIAEMATPKTCVSQFVPTSRRIVQFSNRKDPEPSDTIIYVDGAFDLFHVGHVQFLEQARKLGTYVICGVLPDEMLNKWMGANYPIMNVYERTLSVLSCRFVDEVIIGAPEITEQFLKDYNIAYVVHGTTYEPVIYSHISQTDWFATAKRLGKFQRDSEPLDAHHRRARRAHSRASHRVSQASAGQVCSRSTINADK
jgi:ethanolamine-phosphate cytidylyltransferase